MQRLQHKIAVEYEIQNKMIVGLKGISQSSFEAPKIHFLSNPNKPILNSILNKGLASITKEHSIKIKSKWLGELIKRKGDNEKSQDVKLTDILPLKELAITFFIAMLLLASVIIYYRKTEREDISIKGPIGIFVALFLIVISISTLVSLHNMKNKHLQDIESSLNIVLNTTYNTFTIWANTNKKILSFVADDDEFTSDVESFMSGNSQAKESIKKYMIHNKDLINNEEYYLITSDYKIVISNRENIIPNRIIKKYYIPDLIKKMGA